MPVFAETYKNAIPVLVQGNRYQYTQKDETKIHSFAYLLGAFKYNDQVIPVQFEIRVNNNDKHNSLYVVATIKEDAITSGKSAKSGSPVLASSTISIQDAIKKINSKEATIISGHQRRIG